MGTMQFVVSALIAVFMTAFYAPVFNVLFELSPTVDTLYAGKSPANDNAFYYSVLNGKCFLSTYGKDARLVYSIEKINAQKTSHVSGDSYNLPAECQIPGKTYTLVISDLASNAKTIFVSQQHNANMGKPAKFKNPVLLRKESDGSMSAAMVYVYA